MCLFCKSVLIPSLCIFHSMFSVANKFIQSAVVSDIL
uniref:Uncharacterized protein n=1 Tax=Anguilla anguilla TaxID=7936 RepID=A0A0E9W3Q8_ANGAN